MTSIVPADCEPLLALGTPQLYERNPFRILEVRVDASSRDIQRAQQRRAMQAQLGMDSGGSDTYSVFPRPEDPELERQAFEQLVEPMERFLAELFWFWPVGDHDAALRALDEGDGPAALEIWRAGVGSDPVAVRHNRAVYHHAQALEGLPGDDGTDSRHRRGDPEHALMLWREVIEDEGFWAALQRRATELDDPRLTEGFVKTVRWSFPDALLSVHANLALEAAERGDADAARAHVALVRNASLGDTSPEGVLRTAVRPLGKRIKGAIDHATAEWTDAPHLAFATVQELYRRCVDLLAVVDLLLTEDDSTRARLHDEVADAIIQGENKFSIATNEWTRGLELLELARAVAVGSEVHVRIDTDVNQNTDLAESSNYWVSPGYWELPSETVEALEAARQKTSFRDYEGALEDLLAMDPEIGAPLLRCVAFTLSQHGMRRRNDSQFRAPIIQDLMAKLRGMDDIALQLRLMLQPMPSMNGFNVPDCLSCDRKYTAWTSFTYEGMSLFMCSNCKDTWDRQTRDAVGEALEYLLLAREVDPKDQEIKDELKSAKSRMRELGGSIPSPEALRTRLQGSLVRPRRIEVLSSEEADTCYFCGSAPAGPDTAVTVPMCGNVQQTEFILGTGTAYDHAEVVVPRCQTCRADHAELVDRTEAWVRARDASSADASFPELVTRIEHAEVEHTDATHEAARARRLLREAQEAADTVASGPAACDRCDDAESWDEGLCRACDADQYGVGTRNALLAAGIAAAASANLLFGAGTDLVSALAERHVARSGATIVQANGLMGAGSVGVVLLMTGALVAALVWRRTLERDEIRAARTAAALEAAEDEVAAAESLIEQREEALTAAESVLPDIESRLEEARASLDEAKDTGRRAFSEENPRPTPPEGVAAERTYLDHPTIADLQERGWGFGSAPRGTSGTLRDEPTDVIGLVGP